MPYAPLMIRDIAGGFNVEYSRFFAEDPKRELKAHLYYQRGLLRIAIAALAVFATFKLALAPFLILAATTVLSFPAACLFSAVVLSKFALAAAQAAFITKSSLVVGYLLGHLIINSLVVKTLLAAISSAAAIGATYLPSHVKPIGKLENRFIRYMSDTLLASVAQAH